MSSDVGPEQEVQPSLDVLKVWRLWGSGGGHLHGVMEVLDVV